MLQAVQKQSKRKNSKNQFKIEAAMEGTFIVHTAVPSSKGTLNPNRHNTPLLVIRRHSGLGLRGIFPIF